jgi:DNA-binding NtrC family response regulator
MNSLLVPEWPVLVVDDELDALESAERTLVSGGISHILQCQDARKVKDVLAIQQVTVILLDLSMPYVSGEELLPQLVEDFPEVPVIIVTGANEIETAVRCMRTGAFDYMVKPVEKNRLLSGVRRAIEIRELRRENETMRERLLSDVVKCPEAFASIITRNKAMHALFRYCESIAKSHWPVLLTGETGVGKELLARAIHTLSGRPGDFVAINAAGLDDNMISDALFGHVRGAFTGADQVRRGLIEKAAGGTLFLDEIGDFTPASQVKLLRVLQEREYYPVGSDIAKRTDARIVCATNRDLDALQVAGQFRKDLYHRLHTHLVRIPPLRERLDDIPLLVHHFLERASAELHKKAPTPPKELYTLLGSYSFPGNIRELEGMVLDAVANHESHVLSMAVFRERIAPPSVPGSEPPSEFREANPFACLDQLPTMKGSTSLLIEDAMRRASGNQTIAARLLGISRTALNKRVNRDVD